MYVRRCMCCYLSVPQTDPVFCENMRKLVIVHSIPVAGPTNFAPIINHITRCLFDSILL